MNKSTRKDFGPPIKLATRKQLAEEISNRTDGIAIAVYRDAGKGSTWHSDHNIPTEQTVPEILRELARFIEHCENEGTAFSELHRIG